MRGFPPDKRKRRAARFANMRRLWVGGVSMLPGFFEGEDAEAAVSALSRRRNMLPGWEADEILAHIHTIPRAARSGAVGRALF